MSFVILNIVGLALIIPGSIHLRRCIKEKSGVALAIIFLFFGVVIFGWALIIDFMLLVGYKG